MTDGSIASPIVRGGIIVGSALRIFCGSSTYMYYYGNIRVSRLNNGPPPPPTIIYFISPYSCVQDAVDCLGSSSSSSSCILECVLELSAARRTADV